MTGCWAGLSARTRYSEQVAKDQVLRVGRRQVKLRRQAEGGLVALNYDLGAEAAAEMLTGISGEPAVKVANWLARWLEEDPSLRLEAELARIERLRSNWDASSCRHPLSLAIAAFSANSQVTDAVAKNPSTPGEVVDWMATSHTRSGVYALENPNLDSGLRAKAVRSNDVLQRCHVALNPALSDGERDLLVIDGSERTVVEALKSSRATRAQAKRGLSPLSPMWRQEIAQTTQSRPVLELLAEDQAEAVRSAVARRRDLPAVLRERLVRDSSSYVRCAIAESPATPPAMLMRLAEDRSVRVLKGLASNSWAPKSLLERLANHGDARVRSKAKYSLKHHRIGWQAGERELL